MVHQNKFDFKKISFIYISIGVFLFIIKEKFKERKNVSDRIKHYIEKVQLAPKKRKAIVY